MTARRGWMPAVLAALLCAALLPAPPAAAFSLPFIGGKTEAPPPGPPRPVVTEIVADMPPTERSFAGVIAAATEVQMAFQTLGRLVERSVDVGDRVNEGEVLARLDPDDLAGSVRAAEASLSAAEVNLRTATATADRTRALASRNVASRAQLEQAEQGLAAAQSAADQARAGLERARNAESFAVMTAPISGVVSAVRATPGAVVAAGDPILTLATETGLEATIDLTESQLAGIAPGTAFLVWRDRPDARPTRGTVDRIAPVADAQTRTRRVHIRLDDSTGFRLGSLIRARLDGDDAPVLTVPVEAVMRGDAGEGAAPVRTAAAEAQAEMQADAAPEARADAGTGAQADAAPDSAPDRSPDAGPDVQTDAATDAAPDAPPNAAAGAQTGADRQPTAADSAPAAPPPATPAFVWVVTRSGDSATVDRRPVTTGARVGNRVVITSGLAEGAEVVIRGVHSLTAGQAVGRRMDP